MANPDHLEILKQGVEVWNEWREENPEERPNLRTADITRLELGGANLCRANLRRASISGAYLAEADLHGADLSGADLKGADLSSADLTEVNLTGASLSLARMRDAALSGADLAGAKGLQAHQLGGALTSLVKLPAEIDLTKGLNVVKDASSNARKIFLAMLLGCAYAVLTIATTTDARLLTNSATSPLPIIQAQIPIVGFYSAAPLVLLGFYLYFQFCMHNIWEQLSTLPAEFPDGRTLDRAVDPWLLLGIVQVHFANLRSARPFLLWLQHAVSVFLAWWTVPLTLFLLWARYIRRHEVWITGWQVALLFSVSCAVDLTWPRLPL